MRSLTTRELALNTARIAAAYPAFSARPYAPRDAVRAYQLAALRRLVARACASVPLYREKYRKAGVTPRDLRSLDDLARFPTVTKAEILDAGDDARARDVAPGELLLSKSSGSTGVVLEVAHQASDIAVQGLAMNRLLSMYGVYLPWHRLVYVYTSPYPARSLWGLYPMTLVPTLWPVARLAARLRELRPAWLTCYPSHLRALADELGRRGARALGLRAISVSSEQSSQRERDALAHEFGCGVHDEYSTEELTRIAAQCRAGTYHLFEDVTLTEIVDPHSGAPQPPGARGEIVGTYLHNHAMPFIRYRQGDLAHLDEARCPCGRTSRALGGLAGRALDSFVLPSGRVLTSGWLLDATYSFLLDVGADLRAFTLTQETRSRVVLRVVPGRRFGDGAAAAIARRFRELVDEPIDVEIVVLEALPRSAGGKLSPIVSRVGR
ncbi:MAG: phenylacetate--CoA ligase family protein [Polyangiaceae bacterium]|nr:phenylacetate--CoA ligase family protein [Polyangiaceae bacterium]